MQQTAQHSSPRTTARSLLLTLAMLCLLFTSCSTQKNTAITRLYHSVTAKYNTWFNGSQAYKLGLQTQEKGHKDNFTQLIPVTMSSDKKTADMGKSNYETAITKCEKAIKKHSIKKRPKFDASRKKTEKDRAWLARKEYNPFLKRAWILMGQSQFQRGEFIEAAATFNYMTRLYATQPEILTVARAWLARCYTAMGWYYDAEDVMNKFQRDSSTVASRRILSSARAEYLIGSEQYSEAIPHLRQAIKCEKRKFQRSRLNFLLAQLYQQTGQNKLSYKYYSRVIRSHPNYEMAFNARILQTEVVGRSKSRQMIRKLQAMARNDNNKNYLDQVYFALGNIYLSRSDTARAIGAYETGVEKSKRNGVETGVLLLRLGEIYWQRENYIDAARCYTKAVTIMDKQNKDFAETSRRADILKELEPPLSTIHMQDSLQWLASCSETERNAAIDRVIEALKKKEKEEARKEAENNPTARKNVDIPAMNRRNEASGDRNTSPIQNPSTAQSNGQWYFYNPSAVSQGQQTFRKKWGNRPNQDGWQRSSREVINNSDFTQMAGDLADDATFATPTDTTQVAEDIDYGGEEEEAANDSLANDPHHREYYLKDIPTTEEQMTASNNLLKEALYQAAVLEKDRLENFPLSERTFLRLHTLFPDFDKTPEVYYNLFLLKYREGQYEERDHWRQLLVDSFPEHKLSHILNDPNYVQNARYGKHIEDSLYAEAFDHYQNGQYTEAMAGAKYSEEAYAEGQHRPKFMFIDAMSHLQTNDPKGFVSRLKTLVEKYPQADITELASAFVKGIDEGRVLRGGRLDGGSIWSHRSLILGADSLLSDTAGLSNDKNCPYLFIIAYPKDSINENALLYNLASYNFQSFLIRNFDIEIEDAGGIRQMQVRGFQSFDEVHAYAQMLFGDAQMSKALYGLRILLINQHNLSLIGRDISYDDYQQFYDKTFAPLHLPEGLKLDEQTEVIIREAEDVDDAEDEEEDEDTQDPYRGYY